MEWIMLAHFIGDFVAQTDWQAKNKSKSNKALLSHTSIYTLFLMPFGFKYALVNGLAHTVIDFFTSRESSKRWANGEVHNFFVVIGFDQYLHFLTLYLTWRHF
jgi:hypothetical protein